MLHRPRCRPTPPTPGALRSVALAALTLAALAGLALAQGEVAELTVTAFGAQRLDLATGFTELPDGGEVVDRGTGVRLVAPWLRYAEGEVLEAHDATVDGPFGVLMAPRVRVDLAGGQLVATEGAVLEHGAGQVLRAFEIVYDARDGWAVARGDVVGEGPDFVADAIWADTATGRLVLVAPYRFDDGTVVLRSDSPGTRLQLTPFEDAEGAFDGYDASTTLDDDVAQRLEAGLE